MANNFSKGRYFRSQFLLSNCASSAVLRATVNFGASGAPTIASITLPDNVTVIKTGMGIASIVRSSAGVYVITLDRPFTNLMAVNSTSVRTDGSAPAAPSMYIKAINVADPVTPSITIVLNAGGVATDPSNGESLLLEIVLNNSSLGY